MVVAVAMVNVRKVRVAMGQWCVDVAMGVRLASIPAEFVTMLVMLVVEVRMRMFLPFTDRSVGNSYDNALAETINGLYKAEVIHRRGWPSRAKVEMATLAWVDWYNHRRLLGPIGDMPPAELEASYYVSASQLLTAA